MDTYEILSHASSSTRSPVSLETDVPAEVAAEQTSSRTAKAKTKRVLRLPNVARTFSEALPPLSASVAKWEFTKLKDGESMIVGEIVCGDCGR